MLVAIILPFVVSAIDDKKYKYGFIWITCGSFSAIATVFICIFMRETKGKSL